MEIEAFDELREKIEKRLVSDIVVDNDETISLYSLYTALYNSMYEYNNLFIDDTNKLAKKFNKKTYLNRTFKGDIPSIKVFNPGISEDNRYYVDILFTDYDNRYKGYARVDEMNDVNIKLLRPDYSKQKTLSALQEYRDKYREYMNKLIEFSNKYPNISCEWNSFNEKMSQKFDDGFLTAHLNVERINSPTLTFSNERDSLIANTKSKKYGELYDYIDFYVYDLLKRMKVNKNELNDLYRSVYDNSIKYSEQTLKRVK